MRQHHDMRGSDLEGPGIHSFGHKTLQVWMDRLIVLRYYEPTGLGLLCGLAAFVLKYSVRGRYLRCIYQCLLLRAQIIRKHLFYSFF